MNTINIGRNKIDDLKYNTWIGFLLLLLFLSDKRYSINIAIVSAVIAIGFLIEMWHRRKFRNLGKVQIDAIGLEFNSIKYGWDGLIIKWDDLKLVRKTNRNDEVHIDSGLHSFEVEIERGSMGQLLISVFENRPDLINQYFSFSSDSQMV